MRPPALIAAASHPLRWRLMTELAGSDRRVRELVELVGQPQNLVSYHLRRLRDAGLVRATRSSFDGRDTYYHLDLDRCAAALSDAGAALHPALRLTPQPPPQPSAPVAVLFVCTGNSARSPMAEALLRHYATGRVTAASAGTLPKPEVHPQAVRTLREQYGIDIPRQRPRHVDTLGRRRFRYVVTLCDKARESCPDLPGSPHRMHWSIPDPAQSTEQPASFARAVADIDARVRHLLPVLADSQETQP